MSKYKLLGSAILHKIRKLISYRLENCFKLLNKKLGKLNHLSNQELKSIEKLLIAASECNADLSTKFYLMF